MIELRARELYEWMKAAFDFFDLIFSDGLDHVDIRIQDDTFSATYKNETIILRGKEK